MASPAVLDIAKLTAPIPGANPCGVDLRVDAGRAAFYDSVKGARTAARDAEKKVFEGAPDAAPPDWKAVVTAAVKTLSEKSKDVEVTAYLIEALSRTNGFAGLRDGFRVGRELVEKYWDGLFPMPDEENLKTPEGLKSEEGVSARFFAMIGLNEGALAAPINRIIVTDSKNEGPYATYHYQKAQETAKITDPKVREKRVQAGAMTLEKLTVAVSESSNLFYKNLVEDLTGAIDELGKLNAALDLKCGSQAPGWGEVRGALTTCLDAIKDFARHKLEVDAPKAEAAKDDAAGGAAPGGAKPAAGQQTSAGPLQNRDDAFTLLTKVADFFRRTEPHSFVSYAVEQAVRWGKMPLPDLLAELISEDAPRKALYKQVGIRPPEAVADKKK